VHVAAKAETESVTYSMSSFMQIPNGNHPLSSLGMDLFAVNDEMFMDMFVAPGAIDTLHNEKRSLQKRQKMLQSCLMEFKTVARTL